MSALLRPRPVFGAAIGVLLLGVAAVFAGAERVGPMGLLLGELLLIYAAILWATPTIPPLSTRPVDVAGAPEDVPPPPAAYGAAGRRRLRARPLVGEIED